MDAHTGKRGEDFGMKLLIRLILPVLVLCRSLAAPSPDSAAMKWRENSLAEISALENFSDYESAKKVAAYLCIAMGTEIRYLSADQSAVFQAAKRKLESIPGHAGFLEKELLVLRTKNETAYVDYNYERQRVFTALSHLGTAESVDLLIRLLGDHQDAEFIRAPGVFHQTLGNDELAASALIGSIEVLPLERDRWGGYRQDIPALQAWGREVIEGTKTFQFKGKSGNYTIHGRVPEEARDRKPVLPTATAEVSNSPPPAPVSPAGRWLIVAALLSLGVAVLRVLSRKKSA